tara:strand:- start:350 stop:898 length:549 start_codon:yes stop_codon:yes gene_type:complete
MAIKITIGGGEKETPPQPAPKVAEIKLNISKTANGDYYIKDHSDIDIVVMVEKNKVLALSKDLMSEMVYGAQDRLFGYLTEKGLVDPATVQGGSVYGSMEGMLLQSDELNVPNMTILNISEWIDSERPYFEFVEKFEEMEVEHFVDPDEKESTELGEVPHEETKGTLRPGYTYGPYWQSYTY